MITTNSNLPPAVQAHLDRVLISTPYPNLIHGLVADYREMPAHGGTIWRGRRYNALATAQVPLGPSGQTPPPQTLSALDIDARIQWYGTFVVINEQVQISHQEPVLNEAALRLGQSMRETQDILLRDMLAASMSVISCTGGTNGRDVAVVKSSLIDLELLPGKAGDNKAQATRNGVQRERASEKTLKKVMRCSGLYRNIERLAEMTSPSVN